MIAPFFQFTLQISKKLYSSQIDVNQIYQIFFPGGLEAHAPGAWEQRGHDGHRPH